MSRRKKEEKLSFGIIRCRREVPSRLCWERSGPRSTEGRSITCNFHNYLEIGYCYSGHGTLTLGERGSAFPRRGIQHYSEEFSPYHQQ